MSHRQHREQLGSRLGFLFIAAGCAIGLGNVWRFPYITGKYGGAAFVLVYLFFLLILGLPILVMELAVGRASRMNIAGSFRALQSKGAKWHYFGFIGLAGNYLLMMFYTTVTGWTVAYCWHSLRGSLRNRAPEEVGNFFNALLGDPLGMLFWMGSAVCIGFFICALGLRTGVERITKVMMGGLFLAMFLLMLRAVTLPGAAEGIAFYLKPDFSRMMEAGLWTGIFAAMGQSFFTLSVGIGSMAIFGSYINKNRTLTGEALHIIGLDTLAALMAGMIIFPACSAFGVDVGAGPGLVFIALPNVLNSMPGGQFWSVLFFVFMAFAALTTEIAVFENILSYGIDMHGWSRKKSCLINFCLVFAASIPCVLGFTLLSGLQPLGAGTNIFDLEDFFVSNNLLPLGALVYLLFCCSRHGWGWDNFIAEADAGEGVQFPKFLRPYVAYVMPAIILAVFVQGYVGRFFME